MNLNANLSALTRFARAHLRLCILTISLAVSGCVSTTNFKYTDNEGSFGKSIVQVRTYEGRCSLWITNSDFIGGGAINEFTFDAFKAAADEMDKKACSTKDVTITSHGGLVSAAIRIGNLIRDRGYNTSLASGAQCDSACGLIFISGVHRYMETNGFAGFHQPSYLDGSGRKVCATPSSNVSKVFMEFASKMLPDKAAKNFHSKVMLTDCNDIQQYTSQRLLNEGIATETRYTTLWGKGAN